MVDEKSILAILEKVDEHLKENESKFLLTDNLSRADCYFLPTIQHLRVAGKVLNLNIYFWCTVYKLLHVLNTILTD